MLDMGITPACAWTMAIFFSVCLGLQQALPDSQRLINFPFAQLPFIMFLAFSCTIMAAAREYRRRPWARDLAKAIVTTSICFTCILTFSHLKSLIPVFVPFYLDPDLQWLELVLHFGVSPYDMLSPLFNAKTYAWLDAAYFQGCFYVVFLTLYWQIFNTGNGGKRAVYISTFIMSWIIAGNLFATLLSSVGPTYYSLFFQDTYTAMNQAIVDNLYTMNTLNPVADATEKREYLLAMNNNTSLVDKNGISAMPSVHNASTFLLVLYSAYYCKKMLWFTAPFAALTLVGSIVLGWHYAIDAYAAFIIVYGIWRLNLWQVKRSVLKASA
jgi:hypothetical protein